MSVRFHVHVLVPRLRLVDRCPSREQKKQQKKRRQSGSGRVDTHTTDGTSSATAVTAVSISPLAQGDIDIAGHPTTPVPSSSSAAAAPGEGERESADATGLADQNGLPSWEASASSGMWSALSTPTGYAACLLVCLVATASTSTPKTGGVARGLFVWLPYETRKATVAYRIGEEASYGKQSIKQTNIQTNKPCTNKPCTRRVGSQRKSRPIVWRVRTQMKAAAGGEKDASLRSNMVTVTIF